MRAFQRSAICISVCQRVAKLLMIEVFEARFLEILGNESLLIWNPAFNLDLQFCRPLAY